jgi:hypothetical protein
MMAPAPTSIDREQGRIVSAEGLIACSHCGAMYRASLTEMRSPIRLEVKKNLTEQQVEYEEYRRKLELEKEKDQTNERSEGIK